MLSNLPGFAQLQMTGLRTAPGLHDAQAHTHSRLALPSPQPEIFLSVTEFCSDEAASSLRSSPPPPILLPQSVVNICLEKATKPQPSSEIFLNVVLLCKS